MSNKRKEWESLNAKKIICDNIIFNCLKDCSDYYNINYGTMRDWLNGKYGMPKEFYDLNLHYINSNYLPYVQKSPSKVKVFCDNVIYDSISECAIKYNIKGSIMWGWLNGKNSMPVNFQILNLRYYEKETKIKQSIKQERGNHYKAKKIICKDTLFNCIKDCGEYYNVKPSNMGRWLDRTRKMPQKFIDLGLRYATEEDINTYPLYEETDNVNSNTGINNNII